MLLDCGWYNRLGLPRCWEFILPPTYGLNWLLVPALIRRNRLSNDQ